MIVDYSPNHLRYEHGTPVAAGEQELMSPTQVVRTPTGGFWAVYAVGDEVLIVHPGGAMQGPPEELLTRLRDVADDTRRDSYDREAAATFVAFVDPQVENPGKARGVPRSMSAETGLPPSYPLSGPRNVPTGPTGSSSGSSEPGTTPPE